MATAWIDAPATPTEPDHSKCRHCLFRISWDDYTYTHDASGFADCIIVGPPKPGAAHTCAEPIEWGAI